MMKMRNKILILPIILLGVLLMNSCYKDSPMYKAPVDGEGVNTILVAIPAMDIVVDAATEKTTFEITVNLWGPVSSTDITIPFQLDSTTFDAAAYTINGSNIVIPAGSNKGTLSVDLYSAEMFSGTIYNIYYSLGEPSMGTLNKKAKTGSVSTYNPGFMGPWVGTYNVHAASYGDPGNWDEDWVVTTSLDPADPLHSILMTGIGGGSDPISATIDVDNSTITIAYGQTVGDAYGYGTIGIYLGDSDSNIYNQDLTGTVNAETGEILIDNWGEVIVDGPYAGYPWDVFNTTWTIAPASKSMKTNVPKSKNIENR